METSAADKSGQNVDELVRDFRWFPEGFHAARQELAFVHSSRSDLAGQPFLDNRWDVQALPRRAVPLQALAAAMPSGAPPQLDFIWHTSFCASTLLVHALDRAGHCLGLSEPMVLVSIADAKRNDSLEQGWQLSRLPEIVFRLLARPEAPAARVVVKPSNFANLLIGDAARLTAGKSLMLFSDLPSFLTSVLKNGLALRKYVRRLFSNVIVHMQDQLPWSRSEIFQMSDLEIAALVWHLQLLEFRQAMQLLGPARAASLDCDVFLAHPDEVLRKLDAFYGLGLGENNIAEVTAGSLFRQHSKLPGVSFDSTARERQIAATRQQFGNDIERVVAWSYTASPLSPRGAPLPNPLIPSGKTYT